MKNEIKNMITKELEQFHCSILLSEVREKVRRLKAYGVKDAKIAEALNEDELLPQLVVTKDYQILLGSENPVKVEMEPLLKAIYLLFLKHPEGIVFKNLFDYRQELTIIYSNIRPWGLTDRAIQSIEDVTNPLLNSINEKCTRIRKIFTSLLDMSIADWYYISGTRGEAKKIALPRDLVRWE